MRRFVERLTSLFWGFHKEGKMLEKLKGYRTYLVLCVAVILGAIDSYNGYCVSNALTCKAFEVPSIVYSVLAGLGLYTRSLANSGK